MKRILLALTFVVALGAAGFGMTSTAQARHGCYDGYGYGYGGYGYSSYSPVSYYGGWGYPRHSYYRSHGHRHHRHDGHRGHHHHHRGHNRGGVYFSIGF
jgi:hypothetical protein